MSDSGSGSLSHLDDSGKAKMVDVGGKDVSARKAVAECWVKMKPETLDMVTSGNAPKGDVFSTARIAGIAAAKRTPDLIPLCHPLRIDSIQLDFETDREASRVRIASRVSATDRTGVEMEAMVAVTAAALTVYDMCKAVDREIEIDGVRLVQKSGGRSGAWERES